MLQKILFNFLLRHFPIQRARYLLNRFMNYFVANVRIKFQIGKFYHFVIKNFVNFFAYCGIDFHPILW